MQPPEPTQHEEPNRVPTDSAPGTGRRILIVAILFVVVLSAAFFVVRAIRQSADNKLASNTLAFADTPAPVDVTQVQYAPSTRPLTLPGEAAPWYDTTIYARVSGYVDDWKSDIGDHVKQGAVLATIDTPELDQQLIAARAKVAADKSQVEVAKTDANFARATNNRFKDSPKGVVSDEERDQKQASLDSAIARLAAAGAQVDLDQAEVSRLEAFTEFKKVRAPYDGIIYKRLTNKGNLVTAGSTASTTPLYVIRQFDTIRVFVDVPQDSSADIYDGMTAIAMPRDFAGPSYTGTVARNSQSIDEDARTLKVEVDIANPNLKLLPGTYMEVNFNITDANPPLRVPASAMDFRSGGPEVAVVDKQNIIHFHPVTIARDMGDFVEIAQGLSADDLVALNISNQISDGDHVTVNDLSKPKTAAAPEPNALTNVSAIK